jgi:hypothetical protein
MRAENGKVLVTAKRLSDFTSLIKDAFTPALSDLGKCGAIEALLEQTNLTEYAQNYSFGIMGPKANPILKRLFYAYAARTAYPWILLRIISYAFSATRLQRKFYKTFNERAKRGRSGGCHEKINSSYCVYVFSHPRVGDCGRRL